MCVAAVQDEWPSNHSFFTDGQGLFNLLRSSRWSVSFSTVLPPSALRFLAPATLAAPATKTPAPATAAGHQKRRIRKPFLQIGFQNLFDRPADLRDHLEPFGEDRHLQWPGDGSTNEHVR